MTFEKDVEMLSKLSMQLLQKLEPEPIYVKEYIKKVCEIIQRNGWLKQEDTKWVRTFNREDYILKIAFIHARKGEHITGADLVFELKGRKVIFIQSKRVSSNGRIYFNRYQLQKLVELETKLEAQIFEGFLLVLPCYYLPCCLPCRATFYHLIMKDQNITEERFFHTSEICFVLAGNKSVSQREFLNKGLKPDEFIKMFWECKIGCPDIDEDIKNDILYMYSLLTNRLIIWLNIEKKQFTSKNVKILEIRQEKGFTHCDYLIRVRDNTLARSYTKKLI